MSWNYTMNVCWKVALVDINWKIISTNVSQKRLSINVDQKNCANICQKLIQTEKILPVVGWRLPANSLTIKLDQYWSIKYLLGDP